MNSIAAKATICAVAAFSLGAAGLFAFLGAPASIDGAAQALGRLLALTAIAAVLTHWMAKKTPQPQSWPKFSLVYTATVVILLTLSSPGRVHAAAGDSSAAPAYHVNWPDGWDVRHLEGASNAPQDAHLGSREIATKSADGRTVATIGVNCIPWEDSTRPNLRDEMQKLSDGTAAAYGKPGLKFTGGAVHATTIGKYPALQFELTASSGDNILRQAVTMSFTPHCYMTATFGANQSTYDTYLPTFEQIKRGIEQRAPRLARQQKVTGDVTVPVELFIGFDSGQNKREAVTRRLENKQELVEVERFVVTPK